MSTSPAFTPRVTRYTILVWERGDWGRAEINVLECRGATTAEPRFWTIECRGYWPSSGGFFVHPRTDAEWAAVKYASPAEALAEAPRAAAHVLAETARRLAKYDAAHPAPPAPSNQLELQLVVRTP